MAESKHRRPKNTGSMPGSMKVGTYTCQARGQHVDNPYGDHVFPLSRGGKSTMDNLVTACPSCNCAKHDRAPEAWRR